MQTPCAGATAPSHVRYSNFPESVEVYISDADVPYHHFTGLLPVVVGQCREKGLRLAHLPRNPSADYAYSGDRIPDDCKWGMEEWCKEWKKQGLDPQQQLQQVIDSAKEPFQYLRSIFLDYGQAGINYPLNTAVLTSGARAIADAADRDDQRSELIDLLHEITKAPKKWISPQVERRCLARFQENHDEQQQSAGSPDLPAPMPAEAIEQQQSEESDPYWNNEGRHIDVHLSNQLIDGPVLYGSSQSTLYSYDSSAGFWSRIPQSEALRMVQGHLEKTFVRQPGVGRKVFPYGSSNQVQSALTALVIKAHNSKLSDPDPCIAFTDQTFNCKTQKAVPHASDHGISYGVEAPLTITEACPEAFSTAIETCFGAEALPVIQAWIRAMIDPTIRYGKFLLIVGNTGTGKGMLLEFLDRLLPSKCRSELPEPGDISGPDKVYQYVLGKRYISFQDMPHRLKPMQLFYKLVENAEVSARRLNASETEAVAAHCRFAAAATKLPTLSDGNDGLIRRAILIRTKPRLSSPDRNLKASLVGDSPAHVQLRAAVMGWALSMERSLVDEVLYGDACSELLDANLAELESSADAVSHFINECLIPTTSEVTPVMWAHIYDCFKCYCDANGFIGKFSKHQFQGAIRGKLPHLTRERRKETAEEARAAGRTHKHRLNVPRCDWGFGLAINAFTMRPNVGLRVAQANFTVDGFQNLRNHKPDCPKALPLVSGSNATDSLRPGLVSGSQNPVSD